MQKHRCTGLLLLLLFCLFPQATWGQSPEQLLEAGKYAAAARAFTDRGERTDHFAAAEAWSSLDSLTLAIAALQRVTASGVVDSLSGLAQHKIGLYHYYGYNEEAAAAAYTKAVKLRDQVFSGPHKDRAHSRLNLAQTYIELGQNDTAEVILQQAIDIYAQAQPTDSLNWIRAYNSLALLAEDALDYQVGVNAARQATTMVDQLADPHPLDVFDAWYAASKTYLTFGALDLASTAAERALAAGEKSGYADVVVNALALAADLNTQQEKHAKALELHLQALAISEEAGLSDEDLGLLHFNLALSYGKLNQFQRAIYHGEQAKPLLQNDAYHYPRLFNLLGDIQLRDDNLPDALQILNQGIGLVASVEGDTLYYPDPATLEPRELEILADLLDDRAKVLERQKMPIQALKDYYLLFDVLDNLRNRVTSDESRRYLSKNLRPLFDRAITLEYAAYRKEALPETAWRALALSERAKAYSLLTAVQQNRAAMPKQEATLRVRIAELERTATTGSPEEARLAAAKLELDRLLRLAAPTEGTPTPALEPEALKMLVKEQGTTLIAYHLSNDAGFRWILTPGGIISLTPLENTAELPRRIRRWRTAIAQSAYRRKSLRPVVEQDTLDAAFLQQGLAIKEQLLEGVQLPEKLCILPDGALALLPFGALPLHPRKSSGLSPAAPPINYRTLNYVQSQTAIHYAYSASVWLELTRKTAGEYTRNLLAFAPTFRGEAPARDLTRAVKLRDGERALTGLAPLKHNRPEVEEISAIIPATKAFYAEAASRQQFLDHLAEAKIIHLSTHGVVNLAEPALSFVAFSQLGDSLEYEEMLYFNDLSALPMTAELAVLSACETSLGTYAPGETSLSLSSAFTAAGARSTLTTLWQVDDAATKELTVSFYEALAAGADRVAALAQAQRAHQQSEDYAHPFYWSAMTLYGLAGPIALDAGDDSSILDRIFSPYLVVVVVALFVLLLLWKRRRGDPAV
ncbi:MAG: CHAT domain-containing tetratricopeptide repeat protein [Bacteroidota bacterium]